MGILEDLVEEGKIRWYGWSTDMVDRAESMVAGAHCTSIHFRLNAIYDNEEMRKLCSGSDLAGVNKDPLNKGILTGKFNAESTFPDDDIRSQVSFKEESFARRLKIVDALREILTSGGRIMAHGAISYIWAFDERMIPIPGFKSIKQVKDNTGAMAYGPLSAQEVIEVQTILAESDGENGE